MVPWTVSFIYCTHIDMLRVQRAGDVLVHIWCFSVDCVTFGIDPDVGYSQLCPSLSVDGGWLLLNLQHVQWPSLVVNPGHARRRALLSLHSVWRTFALRTMLQFSETILYTFLKMYVHCNFYVLLWKKSLQSTDTVANIEKVFTW